MRGTKTPWGVRKAVGLLAILDVGLRFGDGLMG